MTPLESLKKAIDDKKENDIEKSLRLRELYANDLKTEITRLNEENSKLKHELKILQVGASKLNDENEILQLMKNSNREIILERDFKIAELKLENQRLTDKYDFQLLVKQNRKLHKAKEHLVSKLKKNIAERQERFENYRELLKMYSESQLMIRNLELKIIKLTKQKTS